MLLFSQRSLRVSPFDSLAATPTHSPRRNYQHQAIKLEAKPRGLKRIKKALTNGPKEEQGETEIEVAV